MKYLGIEFQMQFPPRLDPDFIPLVSGRTPI